MKPNILFILVDGLRADQCFGKGKKSVTPFLDSLIKSGVYFENAFSTADGTMISLNCLFNSKFQLETGIRAKNIILTEENHLKTLKNSNYYISGLIPKLTALKPISDLLQNEEHTFEPGPPPETLSSGMTDRIKKLLNLLKEKSPWFCYLHLFDLHPLREGKLPQNIEQFESEEFGDNYYEKTVSSIDYWLKKILKDVNFENTIVVITSDHGELIPFGQKASSEFEPELKNLSKIGKKVLPKTTQNVSGKILGKIKKTIGKTKLDYSNKDLTSYQKRSREPHFTLSLYDELLHIPFFMKGLNLPSKIIPEQVSNLEIFPTIFELLGINYKNSEFSRNLMPLINNQKLVSKDIFLHTIPYEEKSPLDKIGIRTSKYKYFRNSEDPKKNVCLFDLEVDPYENCNIVANNPNIVDEMERKLKMMEENFPALNDELIEDDEESISEELKKLGYM